MVNDNAALCHHHFGVAQAEDKSQIPAKTVCDYIGRIMQVFEGISD